MPLPDGALEKGDGDNPPDGVGDVGSMANYASFPAVLKAAGMLEMLIGRLEIFPVLYLLRFRVL